MTLDEKLFWKICEKCIHFKVCSFFDDLTKIDDDLEYYRSNHEILAYVCLDKCKFFKEKEEGES